LPPDIRPNLINNPNYEIKFSNKTANIYGKNFPVRSTAESILLS